MDVKERFRSIYRNALVPNVDKEVQQMEDYAKNNKDKQLACAPAALAGGLATAGAAGVAVPEPVSTVAGIVALLIAAGLTVYEAKKFASEYYPQLKDQVERLGWGDIQKTPEYQEARKRYIASTGGSPDPNNDNDGNDDDEEKRGKEFDEKVKKRAEENVKARKELEGTSSGKKLEVEEKWNPRKGENIEVKNSDWMGNSQSAAKRASEMKSNERPITEKIHKSSVMGRSPTEKAEGIARQMEEAKKNGTLQQWEYNHVRPLNNMPTN